MKFYHFAKLSFSSEMRTKNRGTFSVVSVSRPCHLEAGSNEGTVITIEGISMCSSPIFSAEECGEGSAVQHFSPTGGRRRRVCRLKSGLEHSVTGQWSDRTVGSKSVHFHCHRTHSEPCK